MSKVTWRREDQGPFQLTPHFTLAELTASETAERRGINNAPDPLAAKNLFRLAELLEQVRALLGAKPIRISSGYRSVALNKAVGGASNSDHLIGMAADFTCPDFGDPLKICRAIAGSGIKFGQLIWEGTWVHISAADGTNDGQVLTAVFTPGKPTRYQPGLPA